jgi:hypothetical protein
VLREPSLSLRHPTSFKTPTLVNFRRWDPFGRLGNPHPAPFQSAWTARLGSSCGALLRGNDGVSTHFVRVLGGRPACPPGRKYPAPRSRHVLLLLGSCGLDFSSDCDLWCSLRRQRSATPQPLSTHRFILLPQLVFPNKPPSALGRATLELDGERSIRLLRPGRAARFGIG